MIALFTAAPKSTAPVQMFPQLPITDRTDRGQSLGAGRRARTSARTSSSNSGPHHFVKASPRSPRTSARDRCGTQAYVVKRKARIRRLRLRMKFAQCSAADTKDFERPLYSLRIVRRMRAAATRIDCRKFRMHCRPADRACACASISARTPGPLAATRQVHVAAHGNRASCRRPAAAACPRCAISSMTLLRVADELACRIRLATDRECRRDDADNVRVLRASACRYRCRGRDTPSPSRRSRFRRASDAARRSARSVLPAPVGPMINTTGTEPVAVATVIARAGTCDPDRHAHVRPCRSTVIALIAAHGSLHFTQQRVHLRNRQAAIARAPHRDKPSFRALR